MGGQEFLGSIAAGWIALGLLALMLLVHEIAFRRGRRFSSASLGADESSAKLLDSALSLLLGLFLAFSFSLAAGRYETRQDLVVAEANAIGTAFLRCDLLQEGQREACRRLFREYTDLRIRLSTTGADSPDLLQLAARSEQKQMELWAMMTQAARATPNTNTSLGLQAMNEVIDRHGERVAAYRRHVPALVTLMLLGLCLVWAMFNGYSQGTVNRRNPLGWPAFALLISMVIYIIFDFDRQSAGLIRLDASKSLYDLRASMD
jgi:hypothetical protein